MQPKLILEFWHNGEKQAECPALEVWELSDKDSASFWEVQTLLDRAVMVRYEEEGK